MKNNIQKISYILIISFLLQSCYSYKTTAINQVKVGKNYIVTLQDGREYEARCSGVLNEDEVLFVINEKHVKFPKKEIAKLERKKVSAIMLIGGVAVATITAILVIKADTKDIVQIQQ